MKNYLQPDISIIEMQPDVICTSSEDPTKGDIFFKDGEVF